MRLLEEPVRMVIPQEGGDEGQSGEHPQGGLPQHRFPEAAIREEKQRQPHIERRNLHKEPQCTKHRRREKGPIGCPTGPGREEVDHPDVEEQHGRVDHECASEEDIDRGYRKHERSESRSDHPQELPRQGVEKHDRSDRKNGSCYVTHPLMNPSKKKIEAGDEKLVERELHLDVPRSVSPPVDTGIEDVVPLLVEVPCHGCRVCLSPHLQIQEGFVHVDETDRQGHGADAQQHKINASAWLLARFGPADASAACCLSHLVTTALCGHSSTKLPTC